MRPPASGLPGVLALALAALGCPGQPKQVVYDLAGRLPSADRWSARDVVSFGTPAAEPHQAEGFYREGAQAQGDGFVWGRGEAELSLGWPQPAPRAAIVDLAPYKGVPGQSVEVSLNGARVAGFALNDVRYRYRIPLPRASQRAGENRLRFVFAQTRSPADDDPRNPDRRQLAAAFYSLVVGSDGDPGLDDLLARDAPRPFSVTRTAGGVPSFVQVGPGVVRFALRLPEAAELRFTPELHAAAGAAAATATFQVTVEDVPGSERVAWSRSLGPRDRTTEEAVVPLRGAAGSIVRLGLHLGSSDGRFAWGVWKAPRLLGRGAADPLGAVPLDRRGDGLREGLRGTNVLLIVLDAARAQQLGCYSYSRPTTPEIDRIASEGVVFERAYTPAAYTLGAMSSVWTSQHPDRHHGELSYADRLPRDRLTLAEALGAKGIHTAGFVANAMAGAAPGFERGFAEFHEVYRLFPELGSRGEVFGRVLPPWLERNKGPRFFAYLHFREPHFPYDPPPPFDTRFGPDAPLSREQRRDKAWYTDVNQGRAAATPEQVAHLVRLYDGNLAYADQQVGALRKALEASGLWERTLVMITADHGEQLHEHGYISHSAQVYEQSVRIPLVVRFPAGKGPRGVRIPALVDLLDLAPTVLDAFGLPAPPGGHFQGRSLLDVIAGAPGKPLVLSRTVWERPVYALRDERYKLIYDTRTGRGALYDLETDPGERQDRSSAEPLRGDYYRQTLHHWILSLKPSRSEGAERAPMSKEQCENLKSLGYVDACR